MSLDSILKAAGFTVSPAKPLAVSFATNYAEFVDGIQRRLAEALAIPYAALVEDYPTVIERVMFAPTPIRAGKTVIAEALAEAWSQSKEIKLLTSTDRRKRKRGVRIFKKRMGWHHLSVPER
jgi:hypothetical protein